MTAVLLLDVAYVYEWLQNMTLQASLHRTLWADNGGPHGAVRFCSWAKYWPRTGSPYLALIALITPALALLWLPSLSIQ